MATSSSVPQRTCLGCRQVRSKRELIRLVRTGDGSVEIDPTGKKPGRGSYVCRDPRCWDLKAERLNYILHTRVNPDNLARLCQDLAGLVKK